MGIWVAGTGGGGGGCVRWGAGRGGDSWNSVGVGVVSEVWWHCGRGEGDCVCVCVCVKVGLGWSGAAGERGRVVVIRDEFFWFFFRSLLKLGIGIINGFGILP